MTTTAERGMAPARLPLRREPEHELSRQHPQRQKRSSFLVIRTRAIPTPGWRHCSTPVP